MLTAPVGHSHMHRQTTRSRFGNFAGRRLRTDTVYCLQCQAPVGRHQEEVRSRQHRVSRYAR